MTCSRTPRTTHPMPRRGLTMLEMVTAVGIAAVTGAMLVPAIKELDTSARQTVCQANQAEFTRTMLCYTSENQGAWLTSLMVPGVPQYNATSVLGFGWQVQARLAYHHAGQPLPVPGHPLQEFLQWKQEHWDALADCPLLWCPDAAGPESVPTPPIPRASQTGFSMTNGIIGSSIVPNGNLSPLSNFDPVEYASAGHWPFDTKARVDHLEGSPAETPICMDANDIGVRCWSETWRSGYTGEYADPMFRHGSSYRPADNMDQGWWQAPYGWGPPPGVQPRGDGTVNVGMLDGHVETMDEPTMSARWEAGEINYELR